MKQFPNEIAVGFLDEIDRIKSMLDTLQEEINEIEFIGSPEFINPLVSISWIEDSIKALKKDLKGYQEA